MKRLSSRKLAEKYFEDHGREFYKQSEIAAFLAGWAARGKADAQVASEHLNYVQELNVRLTDIVALRQAIKKIEALDE